ncbi:MAG: HAMP domain-containing histidine kinase [Scytonematopsis contorta HA4267-MV1]|nr:HAMP domain-containing histidine kinase [Scytonematopsis contorta HA4267-MV1]
MYRWILPSLSEVLADSQSTVEFGSPNLAQQQWRLSLAATEKLLINNLAVAATNSKLGLVLTAPAPVFSHHLLTEILQSVTFTARPFNPLALMPFLMPQVQVVPEEIVPHESVLPLLPADPLTKEQFCIVFTDKFRLVLVLAENDNGEKAFSFSFDPEVVQQSWRVLSARVMLTNPDLFAELEPLVQKYSPIAPDYRMVMEFSQLLLTQLPEPEEDKGTNNLKFKRCTEHVPNIGANIEANIGKEHEWETVNNSQFCHFSPNPLPKTASSRSDVELLQAFAHEVRTPLTTIRTMTRLLLKRRDLPIDVIKRLKIIDRECTEQIDRMELLFKAAELETAAPTKSVGTLLTPMCLEQVLQQSIPRWQEAASRRNLTLDVVLPKELPTVVSNPAMLDQVLTGLMENFTRSLPPGSHIQIQVIPAGDQLKLQLLPYTKPLEEDDKAVTSAHARPIRKALGQLLMFQPDTGTISLNLNATKHLFQAIGGKLIVRERPQQGEVLTVFLPLKD